MALIGVAWHGTARHRTARNGQNSTETEPKDKAMLSLSALCKRARAYGWTVRKSRGRYGVFDIETRGSVVAHEPGTDSPYVFDTAEDVIEFLES